MASPHEVAEGHIAHGDKLAWVEPLLLPTLALRHLAGQPMSREEALAMRGAHAIEEPSADTAPRGAA